MIWSWSAFWTQSLLQKLHVFASSRRDTIKSSKVSPGCCVRLRRFRLSMVSLTRPWTWRFRAAMICAWSFFSPVVRPRLSTTLSVSLEKQSWKACTCFAADSLPRPDKERYASHCWCHAWKSVPLSVSRSSLRRSLVRNTYDAMADSRFRF